MLLLIYSAITGMLTPIILFIAPYIFEYFNITELPIPIDLVVYAIITAIFTVLVYLFHTQNTKSSCDPPQTNPKAALLTSVNALIITGLFFMALDYFPSILRPFYLLFNTEHELMGILAKSIMVFMVTFLILFNASFTSIKETCKPRIDILKGVYSSEVKKLVNPNDVSERGTETAFDWAALVGMNIDAAITKIKSTNSKLEILKLAQGTPLPEGPTNENRVVVFYGTDDRVSKKPVFG
jgi:hypothetical protein